MISSETRHRSEVWRRAEVAHYRLQTAMYFHERRDLPWASLLFADEIEDPEWNHASLLDLDPNAARDTFHLRLNKLHELFQARERPLSLAIGPSSHPALQQARWRQLGFASSFRQTWHFAHTVAPETVAPETVAPETASPETVALDAAGKIPGIRIEPVREMEEMRAFLDVFASVYQVDLETGEPEALASGYCKALLRSFRQPLPGLRVVHYLATVDGQGAGISSSIHGMDGEVRGVSGLYNLAVHRDFRRRGLGGALVRRRLADARALGQEIIFLQTERESVARRLPRHGFQRGFEVEGWTQVAPRSLL